MLMSPVTARAAGSNRFADAFGELFRRHHRYLRGVARRALPNGNDVEDVVQTALLDALRSASRFEYRSSVRTWLHRITVNAALDARRRQMIRPVAAALDEEADHPVDPIDVADLVGGQLVADGLLDMLSPLSRQLVVMVDVLGFSVADKAQLLGIAEGTVKSRRARAFARLTQQLRR